MSSSTREIEIDLESMTITVPVGQAPQMILIDGKQGKASLVQLADHGDVVVKLYQGKITGFDERKSHRF